RDGGTPVFLDTQATHIDVWPIVSRMSDASASSLAPRMGRAMPQSRAARAISACDSAIIVASAATERGARAIGNSEVVRRAVTRRARSEISRSAAAVTAIFVTGGGDLQSVHTPGWHTPPGTRKRR